MTAENFFHITGGIMFMILTLAVAIACYNELN